MVQNLRQECIGSRTILAARNDTVAEIDTAALDTIQGEVHEYLNANKVNDEEGANMVRPHIETG